MRFPPNSLLLLVLVAACGKGAPTVTSEVPVTVARVVRRDLPRIVTATGMVEPMQSATVVSQVDGILTQVSFREGGQVQAGQVLFQVDPKPYQAALQQARGALARDLAAAVSASRDADRFRDLAAKQYVTTQQLDQAVATADGLLASLQADSAAVDLARLNLQRATIRAPISGRAGGLLLREGNLVRASAQTPLVVINQLAPILVRFAVPAIYLGQIRAGAGKALAVSATPVGDDTATEEGTLTFLDNAVDSLTGTVQLKAQFANRSGRLWPGALVRVVLQMAVERDVLVLPLTAVVNSQRGSVVYRVDSANTAHLRTVEVERNTDSLVVLRSGVEAGDLVVVDGQLRLTDGSRVKFAGNAAADTAAAP